MNHIYKVIWNTITQTWGAVSELSRAKGKTKSSKTLSAVVLAAVSIGVTIDNAEAAINYPQGTHTVNGMAIGTNSYANRNSVAYGEAAKANDGYSVAIGANAVTNRVGSGEIGVSPDRGMIAIGSNSVAKLEGATAIGSKAEAAGQQSTAVGNGAQAKGYNSSAFGEGAIAEKNYGVAVGKSANAKEQLGIAVGKNASAENYLSTAVGAKTQAKGESSIAIGSGDLNGGTDLDAPEGAKATGNASMAVGASAKATADNATALGKKATASGRDSIAAGATANASGTDSIATGHNANATGANAVATGANASAAKNAAAYGDNAKATAGWSSAFGNQSKATATDSSAFGNSANVSAQNGTAIGSHSTVTAINGTALGNQAEVTSAGGVALGQGSKTTNKDGSARQGLNKNSYQIVRVSNDQNSKDYNKFQDGGFSYSDKDTPDKVYAPVKLVDAPGALEAIKNTIRGSTGPVSIGNKDTTRQLINVAPGSADSDAVNVAQLKAVAGAIKHYDVVSPNGDITVTHPDPHDPNKTVWNLNLNPDRVKEITKWKLRNVDKDGNAKAGKTDALVKGDETVTFQDTDTIEVERVGTDGKTLKFHTKKNIKYFSVNSSGGGNENNNGATATDAIAIGKDASSTGSNAVSLGFGAKALGSNNTAIGSGAVANIANGIALGSQSKTTADKGQTGFDASQDVEGARTNKYNNLKNNIQNVRTSTLAGLSIGDTGKTRQINHLAAGTADDDAVNVAQLKSVNLAFKGDNNTKGDVRLHDQRLSVVGAENSFITTKASSGKLEINTTKSNELQFTTGAANNITTPTGLTTDKAVANAINNSGWTLQANDKTVGLINPGDKVNIKAGTGVTIKPTNEANGVSTLTISAAQQNYSWKLKEDSQPADQALTVTNNTAVSLKGENFLNITNKGGGNFVFKTVTADVGMNAVTGATNQATATGLTTNKAVADAIANSGFQLKENGTLKNVVNPGESLNFKPGQGTSVSVDTNGDVQVNANVADIKAGNNVTVAKGNNGVYTINALDTNTQASVSKLNNDSPITIDSNATNSAGAKDYKLDVNVDGTTITKTGGVLKAVIPAVEKVDLTVNKTGDKAGTVGTPVEADKGKFVTAENVVKAVNESFWVAKKGNRVETNEDTTSADTNVTAGSNVTFVAGKNIALQKDGNKFIYATKDNVTFTDVTTNNFTVNANGNVNMNGNQIHNVGGGTQDTDAVNYKQLKDSISTETVRKADATAGDKNIVEVDPTAETGKGTKGATYNIAVKESAVKNIAKTAVKVVDGKNTTAVNKGEENNTQKYAVDVKGDLTEITSITNTTGNGKVEFAGDGVVNITDGNATGNHPIKLDGKTGDITGLTNTTLGGESFAKSGRAATEEQLDIVNKKFDNKVSLGGNSGETTKKALSTDGGIKFNVKAADDNKVVTTEAAGDDVNIKFSGEEAAKVTNLSYKANKGTAKKVTLENGLDFTNGTHTTAEVDDNGVVKFNVKTAKVDVPTTQPATLTGKFDAPETDGVATIKNVVDVVNNSGWKISQGDNQKGIVKAGDEVSFANGDGTTVSVETDTTNPNKRIVKVNATLKEAAKGTIVAVTENGTGDNAPKKGQVKANSGDENKVTTVENVANMINSAKWFAKADNSEDDLAETKNDNGEAVNAGSELTFKAGKNLHVNRTNGVFTFALDSALKDLTSTTYKNGDKTVTVSADTNGDLHISKPKPGSTTNETVDAKITGVAEGTQDNDAVNVKQLKSTELHIAPTKANGKASDVTYTYDDETKSVTLKYKDGNGNVVANTEAKIDLSGLASKIKDYSFKTNATGSNLVETGTETTVASGKSVNFAASDNLTLKQEVDKGNVTYTYGLKNQVVVGEKGTPGADGKPGVDGSIGVNGKDGSAVAINGKDGSIGLNGENGKNGLTIKGAQGPSGVDGKDGKDGKESTTMTRIVYETPKDAGSTETIKHEVATLDDGQKYAGDNYVAAKDNQAESNVIAKKANERLDIVGGAKGNLTEGNIGVNAKDGKLHVQLAEKVNLGDKGSVTIGDTVVNNNGITINSPADLNGVTNKTVSLTNQGLNNGGNKITNVAEGENDTDAVNVKQLKDFKTKVADGGLTFAGNSGPAHKAKLNTTVNIKGGKDNTDATQFDNGKNVMTTVNDNTVTVSIKKTPEVEGINITDTTGNVKVKLTQTDEGLKVSDGDNNETRITNVKAGEKETDAVNVKQLNSAKTEVTAGDNINVTLSTGANGQTIYKVSAKGINDTSAAVKGGSDHIKVTKAANTHKDGSTTVTDYTVDLSDKTKGDIDKGVKAHNKVTNEGLTFNADNGTTTGVKKLGSEVSVNGDGKNITTTADENGVKVSMKDDIKVNSVTAKEVKVGDVNINENGINAGGKRITNVAPGKNGTDAVNVNQLKYVAGNISNQINNVDKGLRAGIAGALASGGLYHVTTAGKSMVSVGAGTYRGQNALAVGYSRLSDNGKVGVKFTVNSNSQGHAGASASVGYQW